MRPHGKTKLGFFPLPVPELVERNGIGETADAVWRAQNTEHQKLFPTASSSTSDASSVDPPDILVEPHLDPACVVAAALDTSTIVAFGQRRDPLARKRRARPVVSGQASLFSLS